ncbi:ribonuclease R [Desulfuromonas carbonis]
MAVTPLAIIAFLESRARRPLTLRDILSGLELSASDRRAAKQLIESMVHDGSLIQLKGDRFSLPRQLNLVTGKVSAHRDGYGFVAPADGGADVFVPARFMREVMHGDRVVVRVERQGRGGSREGRVVEVLERAHTTLVGRFEGGERLGFVVPVAPRLGADLLIPADAAGGARPGEMVVARIEAYPGKNRNPAGRIIEVLGPVGDPEVEVLTVIHQHGLPHRFAAATLAAAEAVPETVTAEELAGREDLRGLPLVTIDGVNARDFDDAVAVRAESGGRTRLWVAIADVGHYVPAGSDLDREALERGTSVYFPDRCIPMLPERLSNGICSLNPGVDRLVLVAELLFDGQGVRLDSRFYPAVMRSAARLTYGEVRDMLLHREEAVIARHPELYPRLQEMAALAERLTAMRRQRGSLDFDLPEAEIILNLKGEPEDVVRAERTLAHRLIEEFMLAANEAVAEFLSRREVPLLYRIHEAPTLDKLIAFQQFVAHFNHGILLDGGPGGARRLQQLLASLEGAPEERMINQLLLRSMKQARYAEENAGHFGLAAEYYCHFTSPIRRYPDLVVHRILRQALTGKGMTGRQRQRWQRELPNLAEVTSQRERRAMEAEREIVALKKAQFMEGKVGEEFAGLVSGVQPFGFFVELRDYFVEGLVHISSLGDDFYHYEEERQRLVGSHRRRIFQVGEEVRVRVAKVSLERREIDFELAGIGTAARPPRRPRRRPGRK